MKCRNSTAKSLLREACRELLPKELLHRRKSPYPKTYHPNYERLLAQRFTDIINNPNSPVMSFLDKNRALAFIRAPAEYGRPWFGQLMAGPQLMAYMIQVNYWMEKYGVCI